MTHLSRRGFLAASAAAASPLFLPVKSLASSPILTLRAMTRTLDIAGRAVTVKGLIDAQGRSGLILDPSQPFRVDLSNDLDTETSIHWHGQVPPNAQDGVPGMPQLALKLHRTVCRGRLSTWLQVWPLRTVQVPTCGWPGRPS